jgi:hypothetical protein
VCSRSSSCTSVDPWGCCGLLLFLFFGGKMMRRQSAELNIVDLFDHQISIKQVAAWWGFGGFVLWWWWCCAPPTHNKNYEYSTLPCPNGGEKLIDCEEWMGRFGFCDCRTVQFS